MSMIGLADPLAAPVNQLDGSPNQENNCAGAALAWGIKQLTGRDVTPTELLTAAYGAGYLGETAIPSYAAAVRPYGIQIISHDGLDASGIYTMVMRGLYGHHPSVVAIPSDWGDEPPHAGTDHFVSVVRQTDPGVLLAANSWGGFWQSQPIAWWEERFRLGSCWELAPVEEASPVWTIERDSAGNVTGAHDAHGAHVGAGFAYELTAHAGWIDSDAIIGESYYASGQCVCALENGAWMDWSHTAPATVNTHGDGGAIVATLYQLTVSAATRIQQLQSELAAAQAGGGDAAAAVAALAKALADVKTS